MKKCLNILMTGCLLFFGFFVIGVQSSLGNELKADIPFDFYVQNTKLSAGEYTIRESNSGFVLLLIQKVDGSENVYVVSHGAVPNNSGDREKLIFHCYNKDYFLSNIWGADNESGHYLPPTRKEKEMEKGVSSTAKAGSVGYKLVDVALK